MTQRLTIMALLLLAVACDKPATVAPQPVHAASPGPSQPVTLSVQVIDVQTHSYSQAPAWFVRVRYQTNSNLPHVVIETMAVMNGQFYATTRAVDLSRYEYDVFYNGAAPELRSIRIYPAEVVGANWHNGMAWLPTAYQPGVIAWHLDVSWPDVFLHPASGTIAQADYAAEHHWSIDISPTSTVTVIP